MITSTANETIKALRKLESLKERRATGLFLTEGLRVVGQVFASQAAVQTLLIAPDLLVSDYGKGLVDQARQSGVPILELSAQVFNKLARKDNPQGIAAVVAQSWQKLEDAKPSQGEIWVALQAVQNPGNLGTILRTCDATGAKGLILLDESTDPYDPVAVKAAMGSTFTIPLYRTDFDAFAAWLSLNPQLNVVGSSDKAEQDCFTAAYPATCLLLMGSEREGLEPEYLNLCSSVVRIPMEGACDSLNLAVATGIILYQIYDYQRTRA